MSGAESVVDEDIGQVSQSLAQLGIVLGLTLDETGILQQHHIAVVQSGGLCLGILAGHIGSHDDFLAQQLAQPVGDNFQAQLRLPLALGLAHMGAQDDLSAVLDQVVDGGQSGDNPLVTGNFSIFGGDIEVAAAQNALAGYIDVHDGLLVVIHFDSSKLPGFSPRIFPKSCRPGKESCRNASNTVMATALLRFRLRASERMGMRMQLS